MKTKRTARSAAALHAGLTAQQSNNCACGNFERAFHFGEPNIAAIDMGKTADIAAYLDRELKVADFQDSSNNGLQVANSGRVHKVCCGVDASMEFFRKAAEEGADFLICHHGLSWNDSLKRITGLNHKRLSFLLKHDMALYACHLPLDAHPRHGNNACICRELGLRNLKEFGLYAGRKLGFRGVLPRAMSYEDFKEKVQKLTGQSVRTMDFGKKTIRSVAVVSGGAASEIDEAGREGVDVYLTGETNLQAYSLAQEYGINAVFAGHYATEVFGVRALAALVSKRFKVRARFIDLGIQF